MSRFVTQDRIKVTVSSMPGSWATISGQEAERENVKLRPGAGEPKQVVHTQLEYGDITVTRLFDADTDAALRTMVPFGEAMNATADHRDIATMNDPAQVVAQVGLTDDPEGR